MLPTTNAAGAFELRDGNFIITVEPSDERATMNLSIRDLRATGIPRCKTRKLRRKRRAIDHQGKATRCATCLSAGMDHALNMLAYASNPFVKRGDVLARLLDQAELTTPLPPPRVRGQLETAVQLVVDRHDAWDKLPALAKAWRVTQIEVLRHVIDNTWLAHNQQCSAQPN